MQYSDLKINTISSDDLKYALEAYNESSLSIATEMKDNVEARVDFIEQVAEGKYTLAEAEAELNRMEQEYGNKAFLPGTVVRKPKSQWTKEYLRDLEEDAIAGAGSREFLQYFAEVSAYVNGKRKIIPIAIIVLAIAAAAIGGGILLKKRRDKAKARKAELTRAQYFKDRNISACDIQEYITKLHSDALSDAMKIANKLKNDKLVKSTGIDINISKSGNTIIFTKTKDSEVVQSIMKALRDKYVDELEAGILSIRYNDDKTGLIIEAH